ncbi:uncharacterized protein LOC127291299 [Leptopilina boulardi]|uniref:uncharacterized protein LOC127291299 n=1 Tax=Leptopilina boulardi TaxID=63433 RepID=UPI0021F572CA|nr:uncharacterized protein LOC127291299 [Leptopilina boulardi]
MSLTPWIDGPFDGLWGALNVSQDNERCMQFEINAANCLEAYGKHHVRGKCADFILDLRECTFRNKQNMRVFLMKQERMRQYRAGERKTQFQPGPEEDAY